MVHAGRTVGTAPPPVGPPSAAATVVTTHATTSSAARARHAACPRRQPRASSTLAERLGDLSDEVAPDRGSSPAAERAPPSDHGRAEGVVRSRLSLDRGIVGDPAISTATPDVCHPSSVRTPEAGGGGVRTELTPWRHGGRGRGVSTALVPALPVVGGRG